MARNGSGTFNLPVAPFTPGTTISSSDVNSDFSDIATALTGSIAADGQTPITGQLKGALGTAPTYSISGDLNTGFGSSTADTAFIQCGGVNVLTATAAGVSITSVTSDPFIITSTDAGAGIGPTLDLYRNSASPAVSDNIGAIEFNGKDSASNKQLYARIYSFITDPTSASEDANLIFQAVVAGALTTVLQSSGASLVSVLPLGLSNATNALALAGGATGSRSGSPTAGDTRYNTTLNGLEYWNGTVWVVLGQQPTVQRFLSGTAQTYTAAAGTVRQRVRMVGPGGGGGAQTANAGANGSADTSFQVNASGTAWTAVKGSGGIVGAAGGATGGIGGTGGTDGSTGTLIYRASGAAGGPGVGNNASTGGHGGYGGATPFGGGGQSPKSATTGGNAAANTGSGGGGGGGGNSGSGGGAGEYVEFWVTGMTSATYTVGLGGAGGAVGTVAGGNGAAGVIIIEEFYS